MDKPTPPKAMTETESAPGWPAGTKGCLLVTDAQIEAFGEAMAAWGAAQYKEDAERYRFLRRLDAAGLQVYDGPNDCSIFGGDLDAAIDKARKS